MKSLIISLLFLLFAAGADAQMDTTLLKSNISKSADSMLQLFKEKDWLNYSGFMHPNVITMLGGKENFASVVGEQMEQLANSNMVTKKGAILQLIKTGRGYQCITESFMQMNVSGMTVTGSSYEIGTSDDGAKWYFTRIPESGADGVRQIIEDLSNDLKLPQNQMVPNTTLAEFLKTYSIKYL